MQELTFEIRNIISERSPNGKTSIRVICVQDNTMINIKIPNFNKENKDYIRDALIREHEKIVKSRETNTNRIGIGTKI